MRKFLDNQMRKFLDNHTTVFEPEVVQILVAAFDDAWATLQKSPTRPDLFVPDVGEILAMHIIEMAKLGERDQLRLTKDAINHLAQTIIDRAPHESTE